MRGAGIVVAAVVAVVVAAGCGPSGSNAPVTDAAGLLRKLPAGAAPSFVGGGGLDDLTLRCGGRLFRVSVADTTVVADVLPAYDYLAACFNVPGQGDLFLAEAANGPALIQGGKAWPLPGWSPGLDVEAAAFSPDGRYLVVAPGGPEVHHAFFLYQVPLKLVRAFPTDDGKRVLKVQWAARERYFMTLDAANQIDVYQVSRKKPVYEELFDPGVQGEISAIALSPEGDWMVVAANAVVVRSWRLPFMNTQLKPWGRVRETFFAGDPGAVVTYDETGTLIHWLINYGRVRGDRSATIGVLRAVASTPAGDGLFGVDSTGALRSWGTDLAPIGSGRAAVCR